MSIYREEAIDTLISCLRSSEHPATQILAAETLVSLQGRFTSSGESLTRDLLLKHAGVEKSYKNKLRTEQRNSIPGGTEETLVRFLNIAETIFCLYYMLHGHII